MNQTPHLSPEELITAGRGEPLAPSSAGHLALCGECAGEARAWSAVARGMRVLAARSALPDYDIDRVLANQPAGTAARPRQRRHGHAWLAAAAAAVVLAGGGYGLSRVLGPAGGGHPAVRADAALTATGCSALKATGGTLTSVSGSELTIRTAGGLVTVTTSANTKVIREVAGSLADVTDGTQVTVFGSNAGEAIDAKSITLRNGTAPSLPKSPVGPAGRGALALQLGVVSGTVTDSAGSRFTVDETNGSRVQVITSPRTTVLALAASSIGQLRTGELTSAVGTAGPNGTLEATLVEQDGLTASPAPPNLPRGLPAPGSGAASALVSPPAQPSLRDPGALFSGLGCVQDAIATTYLMALVS